MPRGRPELSDAVKALRCDLCKDFAKEVRANSGLSARALEQAFGYQNKSADGARWRQLASGMTKYRPKPEKFREMLEKAVDSGWLPPVRYAHYRRYWSSGGIADGFPALNRGIEREREKELREHVAYETQEELGWYSKAMSRAILMLLAHARRCGVSQRHFFRRMRKEVQRMSEYSSTLTDVEIEMRARHVASSAAQTLIDGPQFPETSLIPE